MFTRLVIAALVPALLTACASTGTETEASDKPDRCLTVNKVNIDAIAGTLDAGTKIGKASAVKSTDYENVFMVALQFDDQVGVWATNDDPTDKTVEGLLMAGDGFSREFSDAVQGDVQNGADGMVEAKKCLG